MPMYILNRKLMATLTNTLFLLQQKLMVWLARFLLSKVSMKILQSTPAQLRKATILHIFLFVKSVQNINCWYICTKQLCKIVIAKYRTHMDLILPHSHLQKWKCPQSFFPFLFPAFLEPFSLHLHHLVYYFSSDITGICGIAFNHWHYKCK